MNLENPVRLCAAHTSAGMKITQEVREYAAQKEIDEACERNRIFINYLGARFSGRHRCGFHRT
jgi:hypothetical protein